MGGEGPRGGPNGTSAVLRGRLGPCVRRTDRLLIALERSLNDRRTGCTTRVSYTSFPLIITL